MQTPSRKLNQAVLFFSNSLEILFQHLKINLFQKGVSPFSERMVVISSKEIRRWIQLRLAHEMGIATGIDYLFLHEALDTLLQRFLPGKPFYFPDQLSLTLRLSEELADVEHPSLAEYCQGKEKRTIALAKQLAILFQKYGIYGKKCPTLWEKAPCDWQEVLWQKIYKKNEWNYPLQILPHLDQLSAVASDLSIHLFSFSHLSPFHFHFFQKVGEQIPLFLYQLSPCQEFWSDLPLEIEEDTSFKRDYHPLLMSFGRVGSQMAKLIEEKDALVTVENYQESGQTTQLALLKNSLLSLYPTASSALDDDSIQIHICATPYREVQCLHNLLLFLTNEQGFKPHEILVMAPDISAYEPYIRALFERPQIADLPIGGKNRIKEGIFLLMQLEKARWKGSSLLQLIEHPLFFEEKRVGFEGVPFH